MRAGTQRSQPRRAALMWEQVAAAAEAEAAEAEAAAQRELRSERPRRQQHAHHESAWKEGFMDYARATNREAES